MGGATAANASTGVLTTNTCFRAAVTNCGTTAYSNVVCVTVFPTPTVNNPGNQTLCNGSLTGQINFTGAVPGTTYNWVNDNTSIGLAGSGTGNINQFNVVNNGTTPQIANITVTPTANGCPGTPITFTITVNPTPTVNQPNNQTLCNNTATTAVNFSGNVAGTTYSWTNSTTSIGLAANGTGNIGSFNATNTTQSPVTATITVTPSANGCTGTSQTFTITVNPTPTMVDPADQVVCAGSSTTMVSFTGNTSGSTFTWTNSNTSVGLGGSGFGTILAFTGQNPGTTPNVATVTVTPSANTCTGVAQTFTYTIQPNLVAGNDNTAVLCNSVGSSLDLNTLLNGNNTTGTWAETTSSGQFNAGSGIFDASNLTAGTYNFTYTVTGLAPCLDDIADFAVTVTDLPTAGNDNNATLCNDAGSSIDLNTLLIGADAGGTWSETSGTPSGQFNTGTGVLNADLTAAGVYTFVYDVPALGPCPGDQSTFTITINQEPLAGADANGTICNSPGSTFDLNTLLNGNNGAGTWAETTSSGQFTAGTGILDASGLTPGNYTFTYTVTGIAPCTQDVANFTILVTDLPTAGADNTSTLCNSAGTTLDLNTLLSGADAGGTWAETSGTPSNQFNTGTAVLDASGVTAGTYTFTYDVAPNGTCPGDQAVFTITINQEAIAGSDNISSLCNSPGTSLDLNTLLNGNNQTGTWAETTGSGQFTAGTGMLDASNLAAGVYSFTYTIGAIAPCILDVADFDITIEQYADAGADNNTALCNSAGNSVDLNTLLNGNNQTGTWAETTSSGQFNTGTGMFNVVGLAAGQYNFTYTISAVAPCVQDVANFTVDVEQEAIAGADNSASLCNSAGTTLDLNTLLNGNNGTGTWAETSASGQFNSGSGVFDASGVAAGTYTFTYTVGATNPCVPDVANFTVDVEQEVTAGADNATAICNTAGNTVDLNSLLSGADSGGVWAETTSSGQFNTSNGGFDVSNLSGGDYTFTYTVSAIAPCVLDVSGFTVTVNENPPVDAGTDVEACENANNILTGSGAGSNGVYVWDNNVTDGLPFIQNVGTITYTVTGTDAFGCSNTDQVDVVIHPNPVIDFQADVQFGCEPLTVNFTNNTIPAGTSCMWSFGDGNSATSCGTATNIYSSGTYDVTLVVTTAEGCSSMDTYTNYIDVVPEPFALFNFSPQQPDITLPEVEFTNNSIWATNYEWDFGDLSVISFEENPTHTFPEVGNESYTITLIASNDYGCADTLSKPITVKDVLIFYVPNVFTPDGDSFNQTFKPMFFSGFDIYNYHLTIFDRYGEILFESYNHEVGWDGTYGEGGLVQDGVYIWQVEFGTNYSKEKEKHRGHVSVLK
ncbi:PKD domain-containing protein [Paracrocinitomix mangrovi]|nr:PKD domain-containing protein [Paracrocinitomix mangrovi]